MLGVFALFLLIHVLFFNINAAEWGDSYRILRAAEFLRYFAYPTDEKRPPFFSLFLALRPYFLDQLFWGKLAVLFFSIGSFLVFYKLVGLYIKKERYKILALLLFTFNPVFLYWSFRIMTDVVFSFFVLCALYLYSKNFGKFSYSQLICLSFITVLSILTRFEGYILFGSLGLALLVKKNIKNVLSYSLSFALFLLPYFIFRNPLDSGYFEESARRTYDINTLIIYLTSLVGILGFVSAFYFVYNSRKIVFKFLRNNIHISAFLTAEFVLVLAWPAAIPRLFMPIIPFLILIFVISIDDFFSRPTASFISFNLVLLGFYGLFQQYYKLQFLIPNRYLFIAIISIQVLILFTAYQKHFLGFMCLLIASTVVWSVFTIWIHRNVFKVIAEASIYAQKNLKGRVAYNDVSGVADWYLNQKDKNDGVDGFYYDVVKKGNSDIDKLEKKSVNYILVTNEHNTDLTFSTYNRGYLKQIAEFKYKINGKVFFTNIYEIIYSYSGL